jgi:hypothetical protein
LYTYIAVYPGGSRTEMYAGMCMLARPLHIPCGELGRVEDQRPFEKPIHPLSLDPRRPTSLEVNRLADVTYRDPVITRLPK